jgi:hypothetical protein
MNKTTTVASPNPDPAAGLHAWLSVHAGADPDGNHLAAALTTRHRWLSPDKAHESGAVQVLAVCDALVELYAAEDFTALEKRVRRLDEFANELRALLDKNSDVPNTAAAQQDGHTAIGKMYEPNNYQAAKPFAVVPPEVFERMESCWRDLRKSTDHSIAVSHYERRSGRPEQIGLAAAAKHLRLAGFTYSEIAKLVPDGIPSNAEGKNAEERVRNRVREDRRTIID